MLSWFGLEVAFFFSCRRWLANSCSAPRPPTFLQMYLEAMTEAAGAPRGTPLMPALDKHSTSWRSVPDDKKKRNQEQFQCFDRNLFKLVSIKSLIPSSGMFHMVRGLTKVSHVFPLQVSLLHQPLDFRLFVLDSVAENTSCALSQLFRQDLRDWVTTGGDQDHLTNRTKPIMRTNLSS